MCAYVCVCVCVCVCSSRSVLYTSSPISLTPPSIPCIPLTTPAYTSNIFAVLGLRALYFALAAAMSRFAYLAPGLGIVLLFIGGKLLGAMIGWHVSVETTLIVVLGTLFVAVAMSILRPPHSSNSNNGNGSNGNNNNNNNINNIGNGSRKSMVGGSPSRLRFEDIL